MHKHTDKPCKHDLKVCSHCGDVFCTKCNKEWFKEKGYGCSWYPMTYTVSGSSVVSADTATLCKFHKQGIHIFNDRD